MNLYTLIILLFVQNIIHSQYNSKLNLINNRYALVVGISSYENSINDLKYAAKDAEDFYNTLIKYGRFREDNIKMLLDDEASRENIRKAIEGWLKNKVQKNDLVIIFFSGHGTQIPDTDGDEDDYIDECLVPYDFDNSDYSSVISDDIFAYWIKNLQSERILIVFDNCFSGGAAKQKGISIENVKGNTGKDNFTNDIKREIPRDGIVLLAASRPDQISIESDEFENGIFTHYLLESASKDNDYDFNNIIDLQEAFSYLKDRTIDYSKNQYSRIQEPILINSLPEFLDLFYLPIDKDISGIQKQIDDYLRKASIQNLPSEKIKILEEAYKLMPENLNIQYDLSEAYIQDKDYDKALFLLERIHTRVEEGNIIEHKSSAALICQVYIFMGNFSEAEKWSRKAINDYPDQSQFYTNLVNIQLQEKDTTDAIKTLKTSLEINQFQEETYLTLFYLFLSKDSLNEAYSTIKKFNDVVPYNFESIYWLGMFEKYYYKNAIGDSLLAYFIEKSGINNFKNDFISKGIDTVKSGRVYVNLQTQFNVRNEALEKFPFFDEFAKELIKFIVDSKTNITIAELKKQYLLMSKLNPDNEFINKYLKE